MRILHIIKTKLDTLALSIAKEHALANDVSVLLLHDAVLIDNSQINSLKVFACKDDVQARDGGIQYPQVDYTEIVNLVFDNEQVISW